MAANTLLSCQGSASGCAEARDGRTGAKLGNNSWDMGFVDVDSVPGTFDSSSADLALPSDAGVLFAGLYWGANTTRGTNGAAAPTPGAKNGALLATPVSSGYVAVTASRVDEGEARSQQGAYQAFADVTDLVRNGGAGTYTLANVQSGIGVDRYAGWSLVAAYHSPTAPPRNLTIFDGFETVNSGDPPRSISVSGFRTPRSGPVRSKVGLVAYEGDRSVGGDKAFLNGTGLLDRLSGRGDNFFNSSVVLSLGPAGLPKAPNHNNQLGYDADVMDATGLLPNGATSAAIKLETTSDTYLPGVLWTVTDLFAPDIQSSKSVTDLNGGLVEPGDELEYTIAGANGGQDDAVNTVVTDPVPANTTFVPGSVAGGTLTDAAGDDPAEFEAGANQLVFRVGRAATATTGGRLAPGESYEVRYRVRVAGGTPSGTAIVNQARVSFLADTLGFPVDKATNETRVTTAAPDLAMNKSFGIIAPGTYGFTVTNVGDAPSRGPVVITDAPPAGIVTVVDSGGFTCTGGATLRCERSDSLAPGQSWVVTATISAPLATNTAVVSGGGDVNRSNDTDTIFLPQPSLAVEKTVTPDAVAPGEQVTYSLTVGNRSSATAATSVQLADPVPPGLTVESVEALDQGSCDSTVSCSLGTVAPGGSARVRIRARVGGQVGPGDVTNTATVSGPLDDSFQSDNVATGTFRVRRTARLELSKRLEGTPRAGRPVSWTATVENLGPHDSPGGDFADELPAAVGGASASVPGGSCAVVERLLGCTLPPIVAQGRVEVSITGTLRSGTGAEPLLNGVQVEPETFVPPFLPPPPGAPTSVGPPAPPGASTPPGEVVRPAADVGVAKVPTPDPAPRDGLVTYHVNVTNHGPSPAADVVVRDRLPAGARFVDRGSANDCSARRRRVTCRVGRLRAGRTRAMDVRMRLRARPRARTIRSRITVDSKQPDPAQANNRDRSVAALAPRLALRKTAGRASAGVGDTLTYTLRLTNRGPGAATGVVLCDRPGSGLALRRAPDGRRRGRGACWRIGRLARGDSVTRRAIASVMKGAGERRINRATVRTGGTRAAAAAAAVRLRGQPVLGCSAANPFGRIGPLVGPAC